MRATIYFQKEQRKIILETTYISISSDEEETTIYANIKNEPTITPVGDIGIRIKENPGSSLHTIVVPSSITSFTIQESNRQ